MQTTVVRKVQGLKRNWSSIHRFLCQRKVKEIGKEMLVHIGPSIQSEQWRDKHAGVMYGFSCKENRCKETLCYSALDKKPLPWTEQQILCNMLETVICSLKTKYKKLIKSIPSKKVTVSALHLRNSF